MMLLWTIKDKEERRTMTTTFQEIVDKIDTLSTEDQIYLFEILRQRNLKAQEQEILANAKELQEAIALGTAKIGTMEDLIADLNIGSHDQVY